MKVVVIGGTGLIGSKVVAEVELPRSSRRPRFTADAAATR